jgi:NitT/TauT family transport system substrate-binding protein
MLELRPAGPGRRLLLGLALAAAARLAPAARAAAPPTVRLGVLPFGTVHWVADVIRRHALDAAHGFALQPVLLANPEAGRVALMAGSVDVMVSDWMFAALQRARGTRFNFAPFSSEAGGIMARADGPVQRLADLPGRRLGVAGGPADKSWAIVQAAARADGIDLAKARLSYAAPPLLSAKLLQGELDAVLTFWSFAARLEAAGARMVVAVADCLKRLELPGRIALIGFIFREDWARAQGSALPGFLAAAAEAERLLAEQAAEWTAVRPLMDAADDALFARFREHFLAGMEPPQPPAAAAAAEARAAEHLLGLLAALHGPATEGLAQLPEGLFWHAGDAS